MPLHTIPQSLVIAQRHKGLPAVIVPQILALGGFFTIKAIITVMPRTDAIAALAGQRGVTGKAVINTLITALIAQPCSQRLFRILGNNVDHRHEGVSTVGGRTGAAGNFNPLNVFQCNGDVIPGHLSDGGFVHRTAIHLHLHAAHKILHRGVVHHGIRVFTLTVPDHHTRHKTQ